MLIMAVLIHKVEKLLLYCTDVVGAGFNVAYHLVPGTICSGNPSWKPQASILWGPVH